MKRSRVLAALLCLAFLLGACGKDGSSAEESQPSYSGGLNEATMEWKGQGGAYKMENIELPELNAKIVTALLKAPDGDLRGSTGTLHYHEGTLGFTPKVPR